MKMSARHVEPTFACNGAAFKTGPRFLHYIRRITSINVASHEAFGLPRE